MLATRASQADARAAARDELRRGHAEVWVSHRDRAGTERFTR
ncbi:MAG: hypothetical protein AAGC63_11545 [Propionicimonas sp.]